MARPWPSSSSRPTLRPALLHTRPRPRRCRRLAPLPPLVVPIPPQALSGPPLQAPQSPVRPCRLRPRRRRAARPKSWRGRCACTPSAAGSGAAATPRRKCPETAAPPPRSPPRACDWAARAAGAAAACRGGCSPGVRAASTPAWAPPTAPAAAGAASGRRCAFWQTSPPRERAPGQPQHRVNFRLISGNEMIKAACLCLWENWLCLVRTQMTAVQT